MNEYFMGALLCVVIYICLYGLVDRICKCCEHCANARYCAEYMSRSEVDKKMKRE